MIAANQIAAAAHLAGPDADHLGEIEHENLAVAALPGARHVADRLHHGLEDRVVDRDLDPGARSGIERVLGTAVVLALDVLPETEHFGHGEPLQAEIGDRTAHVIELERPDDGRDQLHGCAARARCDCTARSKLQLPCHEVHAIVESVAYAIDECGTVVNALFWRVGHIRVH